jgi:O-antigen/teichoic acid export membrane protein
MASAIVAGTVAVLTGVACLALGAGGYAALAATIAIMIPVAAGAPFVASLTGYLQSVGQPKRLARAVLATPVVLSAAVVALCLMTHPAAGWVAGLRTMATLLTVILLVVAVHRAGGLRRPAAAGAGVEEVSVRRVAVLGAALLGGTVSAIFLAQLDVLVLGFSRGREAASFYGPASQVADNAMTMAATVGVYYLPTIAAVLARKDIPRTGDLYRWASRWTLVWVAPVVAVMLACPGAVLTLLFGADYDPMAVPLRILALGVLVNLLFGFNGPTVDSLNRVRLIIGRQAVGLAFNIAACAVLVPLFGADGAAIATSSSLLAINLTGSALLYRRTRITPNNPKLFAVAAGLAVAVAVGLALEHVRMLDVARIALVGAVAAAMCAGAGYGVSNRAERDAIKTAVGRALAKITPGYRPHSAV